MMTEFSETSDSDEAAGQAADVESAESPAAAAPETPDANADNSVTSAEDVFDKALEEAPEQGPSEAGKTDGSEDAENPPEAAPQKPVDAAADKDDEVETEIEKLGIKGESAQRFRELSKRIGPKEEAKLREMADFGIQTVKMWQEAGADEQQIQEAQVVIAAVNSKNPERLLAVANAFEQRAAQIKQDLGLSNALESFPDLHGEVENGELSLDRAREIIAQRALAASREKFGQQQAEQFQKRQQQEAAERNGLAMIAQLGEQLKAGDPDFDRKIAYLTPALAVIRQSVPPEHWQEAVLNAYQRLPALPAVAAPKPPVGHVPLRPTAVGPVNRKPKDAFEAFDLGLATSNV